MHYAILQIDFYTHVADPKAITRIMTLQAYTGHFQIALSF
jgi:hypothetical protein